MLPNKFELPLALTIRKSLYFQFYFILLLMLSIIALTISGITIGIFIAAVCLIIIILWHSYQSYNNTAIAEILCDTKNHCQIKTTKSDWLKVELTGESILNSVFIWLNFCDENNNFYRVLLLPDSAEKSQLRMLRIRLLLGKNTE